MNALRMTLIASLLFPAPCAAAGKAGASFLKLPMNARAQSYGPAYVAVADDAGSVSHNPAGLATLRRQEVQTTYGAHLEGYRHMQLAYAYPSETLSFGLGLSRLAAGDFEGRDEQGRKTASFKAEDRAIALGLAKAFIPDELHGNTHRLTLGAAIKHVRSSIEEESAQAFALDLGLLAALDLRGLPLTLGASARNLGPGMRFIDRTDPLPSAVTLAASLKPAHALELLASAERQMREDRVEFGMGLGYAVGELLSLRGRFARAPGGVDTASSLGRLDAGITLRIRGARLDYAFSPMGELGNVQRLTVTLAFGGALKERHLTYRDRLDEVSWSRTTRPRY